jgi:hypothetical protein
MCSFCLFQVSRGTVTMLRQIGHVLVSSETVVILKTTSISVRQHSYLLRRILPLFQLNRLRYTSICLCKTGG